MLESEIVQRARDAGLDEAIRGWIFVLPDEEGIYLVDTNLPEPVQKSLPGLLAEYFASPAIESESLSLALNAPEIPLWPDRTETCPPVLENAPTIRALIAAILEGRPRGPLDFQPRSVSLLLYVDHTGRVAHVVVEEASGLQWWDKEIENQRGHFQYRPARKNGVPVGVWVRQEISAVIDETK